MCTRAPPSCPCAETLQAYNRTTSLGQQGSLRLAKEQVLQFQFPRWWPGDGPLTLARSLARSFAFLRSLSRSLSLARALSLSHTHSHTLSHTHTLSLSLSLSLARSNSFSLSRSLFSACRSDFSLSHSLTLSLSRALAPPPSLPPSLRLTAYLPHSLPPSLPLLLSWTCPEPRRKSSWASSAAPAESSLTSELHTCGSTTSSSPRIHARRAVALCLRPPVDIRPTTVLLIFEDSRPESS